MKRSIAPLALLVVALAPATAGAAVRCVPAAAPGCTTSHATINAAVGAAANDDTIRIAAGSYAENVNTPKRLTFVGAGGGTLESAAGTTTIAPAGGTPLTLSGGGTVRSLRAIGATSSSGSAALAFTPSVNGSYDYVVDDVVAIGGGAFDIIGFGSYAIAASSVDAAKVVDLSVSDSQLKGGSAQFIHGQAMIVSGPAMTATVARSRIVAADGQTATALTFSGGMNGTISESTVSGAGIGIFADGTYEIRRSRLEAFTGFAQGLTILDQTAGAGTEATISDSLLVLAPAMDTAQSYPLSVQTATGGTARADVRGSTLVARGVDPEGAASAMRQSGSSPAATIDLRNSIALIEGPRETGEADLFADRGTVVATSSNFRSTAWANDGTVTAPGTGTNIATDPQLDGAFAPLASSPLIDRGDPALVAPGQLDLAGRARSLDGTGDCVARPDMGAFELPSRCNPKIGPPLFPANLRPELSDVSLERKRFTSRKPRHKGRKRGTAFRFSLSEDARVTIAIQRKAAGRRVKVNGKRRCVKPTRKNRSKPRCTRWVKAGKLTVDAKAGANSVPFSGRLKGTPLKAGSYRATLTAKDDEGLKSRPKRSTFRVLTP
jgi:hypothetical protein